ncbi:MAG: tetratricopeptide repeat protein [Bacteroidota bacterium]
MVKNPFNTIRLIFLLLVLQVGTGAIAFSQNKGLQDSLLTAYQSQTDTARIKTIQYLVRNCRREDPAQAAQFARASIVIAKEIVDKKWLARSYYQMGSLKKYESQYDSAVIYQDLALKYSVESGDDQTYIDANLSASDSYRLVADFGQSIAHLDSALVKSRAIGDRRSEAVALSFLSSVYRNQGRYLLAYRDELKSIAIFNELPDEKLRIADGYKNIGEIEFRRENHEEAVKNYKKALPTYEAEEDWFYYGLTLNRIANSLLAVEKYDEAEAYIKQSLALAEQHNYTEVKEVAEFHRGDLLYRTGKFEAALQIFQTELENAKATNSINHVYSSLLVLGECASALNDYKAAEAYFNEGIRVTDTINVPEESRFFLTARAKLYAKQQRFEKAYEDLSVYIALNDSLSQVNNDKIIEELRVIHEAEQQEKQILIQQKDIALLQKEQQLSKQRQRQLLIIGALLLLLAGAIIYAYIQKNRREKLLNEQLNTSLKFKEKELTSHALHLAHKNEILLGLKKQIQAIQDNSDSKASYRSIIRRIDSESDQDKNWKDFLRHFEEVHAGFNATALNLHPNLSANDLKFMSLLKMNLTTKEIANILNISIDGVKKARYRLRKKLKLEPDESLEQTVMKM